MLDYTGRCLNDWGHHLSVRLGQTDDLATFVMLQGGDHDLDTETRLPSHTAHYYDGPCLSL